MDVFQATLPTVRLAFAASEEPDLGNLAYHDLVKEVLDELLLQRPGCQEPVQVGAQKFCHKVATGFVSLTAFRVPSEILMEKWYKFGHIVLTCPPAAR